MKQAAAKAAQARLIGNEKWYDSIEEAPVEKFFNQLEHEEAPVGVKYNIFKSRDGLIQYYLKNEQGQAAAYVEYSKGSSTYQRNINLSGIPEKLKGKLLKDYRTDIYSNQTHAKAVRDKAYSYVKNFNQLEQNGIGLFIYSEAEGSGKTLIAAIIANMLMSQYDKSIKFVNAVNFFADMKRSISNDKADAYSRSHLLESVLDAGILIMDDLGAGKQSEYISDLLYEIIKKRTERNKVTIFTSKRAFRSLPYDKSALLLIEEKCLELIMPPENVQKLLIAESKSRYEDMLKRK